MAPVTLHPEREADAAQGAEGRRVGKAVVGAEYRERGVTLDGRTFIVLYDPEQYEPGSTIVSATPIDHVVDLDD